MATNRTIRFVYSLAALLAFSSISFAAGSQPATDYLRDALSDLCRQIQSLIPVTAMLLVVAAAVIYSIGQMFGAETRARATVWATSCLTGAVIGVIIATVAPSVLSMLAASQVTCG